MTDRYGDAYGLGFLKFKNNFSRWIQWKLPYFKLVTRSFDDASEYCRNASECRGISEENELFYTHSKAQVFGPSDVTSWRKGIYWAENFVPRVSWGARSPGPGITGNMDPLKMVGIMGHHTTGPKCLTQSACKSKMREFQLDDMNEGFR